MDPFTRHYWSQLEVVLWVYTRSRSVVRLAADQCRLPRDVDDAQDDPPVFDSDADLIADAVMPGGRIGKRWRSRLRPDCSFEEAEENVLVALGSGRLRALGRRNGEGDREQIPRDQWADLQFYWAHPPRELLPRVPQSVNRCDRYVGPRDQLQHNLTYWTDVLLEREEVLALWPDPVSDILRTETERLTLAEAVTLLVHDCLASKDEWRSLRRQHGGKFPAAIEQGIEEAGHAIMKMIRDVQAWGRPCDRDPGTGCMMPTGGMALVTNDRGFLEEHLWVDPCEDAIWTRPDLGDGRFNPVDRGYRDVLLNRAQFLAAITAQNAPARLEAAAPAPPEAPRRGRRPKYDWEAFHCEMTRIANTPDGLPECQADLERMMMEWCREKWGQEPAESTVRMRVSEVYRACIKAQK